MSVKGRAIAFFGATGGCVIACLHQALENGYECRALVRSESKLQTMLQQRGVSPSAITANLSVVQGDAKDSAVVKRTLIYDGKLVNAVVSGVGGYPVFYPNPFKPTLPDPTLCEDAIKTVLDCLRECPGAKPYVIALSTTGISDHGRDVPIALLPLYHWLLPSPHADKKAMENALIDEMKKPDAARAISGYLITRASLLTDGAAIGTSKVRVGDDKEPAIGYTISRNDVGLWIFEEGLVKGGAAGEGRIATVTY